MEIKKVAVIGSGTMGSGIAAHVANAGIPVILLDLSSKEGSRNQIAENAKEKILKSRPPLLVEKKKIDLIFAGNIEDNFNLVGEADWVVEAVVERIDIKHSIYKKIEEVRKPESVISSNTSTIPLKVLSENMSDEMKKIFCITHFFNPVRYMALLEIVTEPINDINKINFLKSFCDEKLGKGVILCKDTPGFIGNRVGVYAMQVAMTEAFKMGLTIEEADAVFGRPMGIPKTGVFGLYDLIGIDLMADVLKSFIKELPKEDPFHEVAQENPFITKMIEEGYTGRKGRGGFYRMNKEGEKKVLESIDLKTGNYSPTKKIIKLNFNSLDGIQSWEKKDKNGKIIKEDKYDVYASAVLSKIINYSISLIPQVTSEYNNIDEAMRLGFNWEMGPFEMFFRIGPRNENLKESKNQLFLKKPELKETKLYGRKQLYLDSNLLTLRKIKNAVSGISEKIRSKYERFGYYYKQHSAKLYPNSYNLDLSSTSPANHPYKFNFPFTHVEFTTKANTLDPQSMRAIKTAIDIGNPILIINDGMQFSAGVNLNIVLKFALEGEWKKIEEFIINFQNTCKIMKYCDQPVISAPSGLAIGGGFEVVCQSNYTVSHTNVVLGLVETLVGLIPAGGGCKEMLWRWMQSEEAKNDPTFAPLKVFELIGYAKTATSPNEAMPHKFLLEKDKVVINRDRLLHESEKLLEEIQENYKPPEVPIFKLSGSSVRDKMYEILENLYKEKKILDHGLEVGKQLSFVLSGGNTTYDKELSEGDIYALELEAFMNLIQMPKTLERIKHTLETGKPLQN